MKLQPNIKRFEDVRNSLISAIVDGQFKPGDRLPSLRDLRVHFKVSLATIQRAIQELKEEEWLISAPSKGISVADPLPPLAYLLHLKQTRRADPVVAHEPTIAGLDKVQLTCLIYDGAMLPLFEWAAQEYADAYAPYSLKFEVRGLPGRDDEESMRALDADLILLPGHAINRATRLGSITPCNGILDRPNERFADIPLEILDLVSYQGKCWAMPLMAAFPMLVADADRCQRFGIDWESLTSVEALITAFEKATASHAKGFSDALLSNLTFTMALAYAAGAEFPGIRHMPEMIVQPLFRSLLERLARLAHHPSIVVTRFDQWASTDLPRIAVGHYPSNLFCRDPKKRDNTHVLPIPGPGGGTLAVNMYSMCVSARSVHVYEAWEWAARLGSAAFQARLAALAYDVPASGHPDVRRAFGRAIGAENAEALLDLARRPNRANGVGPEDVMGYYWEVLGNEIYGFITGKVDYDRMVERVATKTERFLLRSAGGVAAGGTPPERALNTDAERAAS
jgi:DNA-binding transcriptional regulator YhcF (GntR family)